jgi:hypothetical protein
MIFAVPLLWLATISFIQMTAHASTVRVAYTNHGSLEESSYMQVSSTNNGHTQAEETGRKLKKVKKGKTKTPKGKPIKKPSRAPSRKPSRAPSKKPSQQPSEYPSKQPSKAPSPVLLNTIVSGPTIHRAGTQACDVIDEDNNLNRYQYCTLFGINDPNCQATNAVSGPFYFNRDTGGQDVTFNFEKVPPGDAEDSVCIKINTDVGGKTKGYVEFWDDVDQLLSSLTSFSFDWYVKSCPAGDSNAQCLGRLYLGIYTRTQASNIAYYNCRYNVYFASGGTVGVWNTFTLGLNTPVNTINPNAVPCTPATTLQDVANKNFVLGTKNSCGDKYPYAINLGDTSANSPDAGLEVCFKNFQDKIGSKDVAYTFKAV